MTEPAPEERLAQASSGTPSGERPSAGELLARFAVGEGGSDTTSGRRAKERTRLLGQLTAALAASAQSAGGAAVATGRWLGDLLLEAAPHLPVRDLETLQRHHKGLEGEELADVLSRNAVLATSAVGVAGGALSAVKYTAPVTLLTFPIQLAIETLAVASIEVKLVGELHAVYGVEVSGTGAQRGVAFAVAWANRRGIDPGQPLTALSVVTRKRVGRRVAIRAGRNIGTLAPLFAGAFMGAYSNRRETQLLADGVRADLRRRRPLTGGLSGMVAARLLRPPRAPR